VIDAKVSLTAFEEFVNAVTEEDRSSALARHIGSMKTHIRTLGAKEYHSAVGSALDYVVMFVPIEGALAVALQEEPGMTGMAAEANVAIATPTTLMIALRTIANVWQVERRNKNAEEIAARAGKIYDKFVGFLEDMTELGGRLDKAKESFHGAMGKLSDGKGNIVRQVEQLKGLGARTTKAIPGLLLEEVAPEALPLRDGPEGFSESASVATAGNISV
jgi:DNA recombination protein RmuC